MIKTYFTEHPYADSTPVLHHSSSFIDGIAYHKSAGILDVLIASKTYHYEVSLDLADQFSKASSWGKFYDDYIKHKKQLSFTERSKRIASSVTSFAKKGTPSSIGEVFGVLQLASLVMPIQISFPLRLAIGAAFITGDMVLKAEGIEKPPILNIAINIASGYSLFAALRYPLSATSAILRTPIGNLNYLAAEGTMAYSVTKPQAISTFLLGGRLGRSMVRGMENMLYVIPPTNKMASEIVQKSIINNPIFAQKTVQQAEAVFTPSDISRIGMNVSKTTGIDAYLNAEKRKESMFKWMEIGASTAIGMLPVSTYLAQGKVQVHKPATSKKSRKMNKSTPSASRYTKSHSLFNAEDNT